MAGANLPAKKYSKKSPTISRLSFECSGNTTRFIDIGLALSAVNRKFYRQGVYYYVNSIEVYNNSTGVVDVHTLPDNWVTKNSWNRGFQMFQKMNRLVGPPIGAFKPKYHDFKVYINDLHRTSGSMQPSLHNINGNAQSQLTDDWVYSEFVSADADANPNLQDPDKFHVHMIGPHSGSPNAWDSVSLIKSYAETRGTVQSEDPEDANIDITDPLLNLFDFSSEEQMNSIAENLLDDNDNPPYNYNQYPGEAASSLYHVARIGTEQGVGRVGRAAGFCVPFGLLCVDPWGLPADDNFRVVLNLAVGTYHGVYAERA